MTSLYKIIAKVLAKRLQAVLGETIDVMLVANEVVEDYKKGNTEGLVFKIDFEKAYDNVRWGFLDFVLQKKNFGSKWRGWIKLPVLYLVFSLN